MTRFLLATIAFYHRWLSPAVHAVFPGGCRYLPTCSEYAATAIAIHGPMRGMALAAWRILRCHPFARGGLDLVPPARAPHDAAGRHVVRTSARPFPHEPLP